MFSATVHEVDIPGALTVSEERSFDPFGAANIPEFRRRDPGSRSLAYAERPRCDLAREMPAHPFDLIMRSPTSGNHTVEARSLSIFRRPVRVHNAECASVRSNDVPASHAARSHRGLSAYRIMISGTGIAADGTRLLAGAERVEGTLFGNGERTGKCRPRDA